MKHEIKMTEGKFFPKLLIFSLPLMATGILQLLYNAADMIVVGRFCGKLHLGAVGSTGSLVMLITTMFMGLSVGATISIAKYIGAKKHDEVSDVVHTSIHFGVIMGAVLGIFGFFTSTFFLKLMDSPEDIIDLSSLYMKIYFLGMPASFVYNYGTAILRSVGDTKRPLIILALSGLLNVGLNVLFVMAFKMHVAGVALATDISQTVSALAVIGCLIREKGPLHFSFKKLKIKGKALWEIIRIGIPAGIQSTIFSFSNVIIQSTINALGSTVVAANAAAVNLEGFMYVAMNSVYHSAMSFTGQNYGAKMPENFDKILYNCLAIVFMFGAGLGAVTGIFGRGLLYIYNTDPEVISIGMERLLIFVFTYYLCGMNEVICGQLRGVGESVLPTVISVFFICVFRLIWIYLVYPHYGTYKYIIISYPISWIMAFSVNMLAYYLVKKKIVKKLLNEREAIAKAPAM